jgi:hypothetical protein
VKLHYHSRAARLTYLPAYHLRYAHGEKYTPSRADIVPAEYDALVGGAAGGAAQPRVDAELHPSPLKSQAAAAAAVATVGLGVMPLTSFALGVDPGFIGVAGVSVCVCVGGVLMRLLCCAGMVWAWRVWPCVLRQFAPAAPPTTAEPHTQARTRRCWRCWQRAVRAPLPASCP